MRLSINSNSTGYNYHDNGKISFMLYVEIIDTENQQKAEYEKTFKVNDEDFTPYIYKKYLKAYTGKCVAAYIAGEAI